MSDVKRMLEALGVESTEAKIARLTAAISSALSRAERAERERDEWRHRCGCTPECELHCCSQDCDNAGAEEASWRGAWDLLDEARSALSSALSRAEAAERELADIEMALTVKWTKAEARARALEVQLAAWLQWFDGPSAPGLGKILWDETHSLLSSPPPTKKEDADG